MMNCKIAKKMKNMIMIIMIMTKIIMMAKKEVMIKANKAKIILNNNNKTVNMKVILIRAKVKIKMIKSLNN